LALADSGKTWDADSPVQMWDARTHAMIGQTILSARNAWSIRSSGLNPLHVLSKFIAQRFWWHLTQKWASLSAGTGSSPVAGSSKIQ